MDKASLIIGRFQPLHDGHRAIIDKLLAEGKKVCVRIMATEIDERNPYSIEERFKMFEDAYDSDRVEVRSIPVIDEVCYGRNVGYHLRRVHSGIEHISASSIRSGDETVEFKDDPVFVDNYKRIAEKVHRLSAEQGFWRDGTKRNFGEMMALLHSEISEAVECARLGDPPDKNIGDFSGIEVQLADVLGILMDAEEGFGLNIAEALLRKMEFNKSRGYMHGGKRF